MLAEQPIEAGKLIERSPVVVVPPGDRAAVDGSAVGNHIFMWEHGSVGDDLYRQDGRAAVALGCISLVNHSSTPNCEFVRHIDELMIDLVALRAIEPGEELTIDYGMTLWFMAE